MGCVSFGRYSDRLLSALQEGIIIYEMHFQLDEFSLLLDVAARNRNFGAVMEYI